MREFYDVPPPDAGARNGLSSQRRDCDRVGRQNGQCVDVGRAGKVELVVEEETGGARGVRGPENSNDPQRAFQPPRKKSRSASVA